MMFVKNLFLDSLRCGLKINQILNANFSTCTQPLCLYLSPILMEQPSKKKKKPDMQLQKMREERKRKKLFREITRLKNEQKQLKPLDENEIPYPIVDNKEKYTREKSNISFETLENRIDIHRAWSIYKSKRTARDLRNIDKILCAQFKALEQLRIESPILFVKAIQFDNTLLPFTANGVTHTPPIENYESPDGNYNDISRKWEKIELPGLEEHLKKKRQQLFAERAAEKKKKKIEKLLEDIDD